MLPYSSPPIPERLRAARSSERHANTISIYKDLSKYSLDNEEKLFVCQAMSGEHDFLEPTKTTRDGVGKVTAHGLSLRYKIPRSTMRSYMTRTYNNENIDATVDSFFAYKGCPKKIDEKGMEDVVEELNELELLTTPVFKEQLAVILLRQQLNTNLRRGQLINSVHDVKEMCKTTVDTYKFDYDIRNRIPQDLTTARKNAVLDSRLTFKTACLLMAFSSELPAELKWNGDSTTIECRPNLSGSYVCVVRCKGDKKPVTSSDVPGELNLLVKMMLLVNAAGQAAPLTIIIAVKDMEEDSYYCEYVTGLTNNTAVGSGGWIYFCRTKAGTGSLWKHWFLNVAIPCIASSANVYNDKKVKILAINICK